MGCEAAAEELRIVGHLQACWEAGDRAPEVLFDDIDGFVADVRPQGAWLEPDDLVCIRRFCVCGNQVRQFLSDPLRPEGLRRLAEAIRSLPEVIRAIDRAVDADGQIKDGASDALRHIRGKKARALSSARRALQKALRKASAEGWAAEDQPTVRGGRLVIPVRAEAKRKFGGIIHDSSSTGQTVFIEPTDCVELNNDVRELEAEERAEIVRLLKALANVIREHSDPLVDNQHRLVQFDVRRAKAILAVQLEGIVPEQLDESVILLKDARNPELVLAGQARTIVPLTLTLGAAHTMLVISGPNAGGKSVAMKTVGLLAHMLACGIPIPAHEDTRFDRFDLLVADIGDEQSVEDDLSTFSSRLRRTRVMLDRANRRSLVLIDEAGTGTDPQEGAALAQAALEVLHESGARVVVTTHHGALKRFAHGTPGASNAMMRFDQDSLLPTYVLDEGLPGASYAFEIADRMGLPANVVERGRKLAGAEQVSLERLLSELQSKNHALESELERQAENALEAKARRTLLEKRLSAIQEEREAIRQRSLAAAEEVLRGANAEVERAVREIRETQADSQVTREARARLDESRKVVAKARSRSRRRGSPKLQEAPGPIGQGDRVRIGPDGPTGEVLETDSKEAIVAIGPAHTRVAVSRLIKVGGARKQEVSVRAMSLSTEPARLKIDVRGKRALEAISEVERFVDQALSGGLDRAEILHGKGTGALRMSIHEYLDSRQDIAAFEEAPIEEGGAGVTIVSF